MCTSRNATAASQEIIKAGWAGMVVGSKKRRFFAPDGDGGGGVRNECVRLAACVARVPRQQPLYGQSRGVMRKLGHITL